MDNEKVRQRIDRQNNGTVHLYLTLADGEAVVQIDISGRRPCRLNDERLGLLIDGLTRIRAARNDASDTIAAIGDDAEVVV